MNARIPHVVLPLVGLLLLGPATFRAADSADPPYIFVNPEEPVLKDIRRLGETTTDRLGNDLLREVRQLLAVTPTIDAVGSMHLKNYKLPPAAPGSIWTITQVKRTSLRVRNPANAPDDADRAALDLIKSQLEQGDPVSKVLVQRVTTPGQPAEWRVYRPISAMNECMQCHGNIGKMDPRVADRLQETYPEDKAINYREWEWRGLLRVSIVERPASK
ncbi:MAG TPA: DUF3365 domain-containing protein [Lacunisphaera sp.]|nr:DUF3365 domain-containing protein [Lacunisphaera sp.]